MSAMSAPAQGYGGSISPLPEIYRRCQTGLLVTGIVSLVTSGLLFFHITYKLIIWKVKDYRSQEAESNQVTTAVTTENVDLNLGLSETHYYQTRQKKAGANAAAATTSPNLPPPGGPLARSDTFQSTSTGRSKPPNPLLLLIYNLILSDIWLAAAYLHNAVWLSRDGIDIKSPTCHTQAWNISFGTLVTSGFLFAISLFSYFGIIQGRKPSTMIVILACAIVWISSIFLASIGLIFVKVDEFYGRQTIWCWISESHKLWRLTVYCWGYLTICGTFVLYAIIFYRLWREGRSSRYMPNRQTSIASTNRTRGRDGTALRPSGHHPAFLVYPCIYIITGTPIMLGSLITTLERNPLFMGISGALLAATGLFDSILWSSIICFSSKEDIHNAGLDHFTFMRTPEGRTLGNIVFVQGGNDNWKRQSWHSKKAKDQGWWRLGDNNRNGSQVSLPRQVQETDQGIQLDIVTSVVVEGEGESEGRASSVPQSRAESKDSGHENVKSVESPL